jgi:hypothetical protein
MQGNVKKNKFSTLVKIILFILFFQFPSINQTANAKTAHADFMVSVEIPKKCSVNVDPPKLQNYDIIKILLSANVNINCNHPFENSIKIINRNKKQLDQDNIAFNITKNKFEPIRFTKDSLVNVFLKSTVMSDADDDLLEFDKAPITENKNEPKLLMASLIGQGEKFDNDRAENLVVYLEITY